MADKLAFSLTEEIPQDSRSLSLEDEPQAPMPFPSNDISEHAVIGGYLADGETFGPSYHQIHDEMTGANGESQKLDALYDKARGEELANLHAAALDLAKQKPEEFHQIKQAFHTAAALSAQEDVLRNSFAKSLANQAETAASNKVDKQVQTHRMDEFAFDNLADMMVQSKIEDAMASVQAAEPGVLAKIGDFIDLFTPGAAEIVHQKLYKHVFGEGRWQDFVLIGETRAAISAKYTSLRGQDKLDLADDLINYTRTHAISAAGALGADKNQFAMLDILSNTLKTQNPDEINWDRWLNNFAGVLDWVYAGTVVRGARNLKIMYNAASTLRANAPLRYMMYFNPQEAKAALKGGAVDAKTLQALGVTFDDVVENFVIPKPPMAAVTAAPSGVIDALTVAKDLGAHLIKRTFGRGELFTPTEKITSLLKAQANLEALSSPYYFESMSTMQLTHDGYAINATLGKTADHGWGSLDEAVGDFREKSGWMADDPEDTVVLRRIPGDVNGKVEELGSLRDIEDGLGPKLQPEKVTVSKNATLLGIDRLRGTENAPLNQALDRLELYLTKRKGNPPVIQLDRAIVNEVVNINGMVNEMVLSGQKVPTTFRPLAFKTKVLKSGKKAAVPEGEYFIRYRQSHLFDETDKIIYGGDPTITVGNLGRWRADPDSQFSAQEVILGAKRSFQLTNQTEQHLHDIAKPFTVLPNASRMKIDRAVSQGIRDAKEYTDSELTSSFKMTDGEKMGYRSARQFWHTVATLEDAHAGRWLQSRRYRMFTRVSADLAPFVAYTKEVKLEGAIGKVKTVFDPETRTIVEMDASHLRALYEQGHSIEESVVRLGGDQNWTHYVLRDGDAGIAHLPKNVLYHPPGWVKRNFKQVYEVERVEDVLLNGEKTKIATTVARAGTRGRGEMYARNLSNMVEHEGTTHQVVTGPDLRMERPMREGIRSPNLFEQYAEDGRFGPDVNGPTSVTGLDGRPAEELSPIESLNKTASAVAQATGTRMFTQTQRTSFVAFFKDKVHLPDKFGVPYFPGSIDEIRAIAGKENTGDYARARDLWSYIKFMENVETGPAMQWRGFWVRMAEKIEGRGDSYMRFLASKPAMFLKDHNPLSYLQTAAFTTMIAANPFRQMALQAAQASFLIALNPGYVLGAGQRDFSALQLGLMTATRPALYEKSRILASKLMGITPNEYDIFINTFRESGLLGIIDSHSALSGSLFNAYPTVRDWKGAPAAALGNSFRNTLTLPGRVLKKIGFDVGEGMNLGWSWIVARQEFIEKNPKLASLWASPKYSREINARAESYSMSMNKTGQFAYQDSWMSAIMQFLAIQHKTYLAMLPGAYGNATFKGMKGRLALGQLLLWGPGMGFGVSKFLEYAKRKAGLQDDFNNSPTGKIIDDYLTGGLVDLLVNASFKYMLDEDTDLLVSGSFAPLSGAIQSTPVELISTLLGGEDIPWDNFLGPSAGFVGKTKRAIDFAGSLRKIGFLESPEQFQEMMFGIQGFASIFSGWSNLAKSRFAHNTNYAVDSWGNSTVQKTYHEMMAQALFGVTTQSEQAYFDAHKTLRAQGKEVEDLAQEYYNTLNILSVEWFNKEHNDGNWFLYEEAVKHSSIFLATLEEHERSHFWDSFAKAAERGKNAGDKDLYYMIAKMIDAGSEGKIKDMEQLVESLKASGPLQEQDADRLLHILDIIKTNEYKVPQKGE